MHALGEAGGLSRVAQFAEPMRSVEKLSGDSSLVIASPLLREVRAQAELVAGVNVPVLVLGETGTGKDMIARLIHKLSPRSNQSFLKVNCAAVTGGLVESELFGYETGAFTGASHTTPGRFQVCDGGTLYLDEIGEMPLHLQAKLLHVLQDRTFFRLGGRAPVTVDVRVVAATNVDVTLAVREGKLREDLYYRLSVFTLTLPPLRDRPEEIPFLFRYFLRRFAGEYSLSPRSCPPALVEACLCYKRPLIRPPSPSGGMKPPLHQTDPLPGFLLLCYLLQKEGESKYVLLP
ncbi:MAG: sigma 54-interacting transcriptional regulator [Terriglobia bacterium]